MPDISEPSLIAFGSEAEAVQWLLTAFHAQQHRIIQLEKDLAEIGERSASEIAEDRRRIAKLEKIPAKPGKKSDLRKARLAEILVSRKNQPMTFSEAGKVLELGSRTNGKNTREQNMTHFGKLLEATPREFEISASKMGGKLVRLTKIYYDHLKG